MTQAECTGLTQISAQYSNISAIATRHLHLIQAAIVLYDAGLITNCEYQRISEDIDDSER